jgi:hypothetical protein
VIGVPRRSVGIRWTIGDVNGRGFEALRLSIWGAWRAFGPDASYVVCVNTVSGEEARARTGPVPDAVVWRPASDPPGFLREHLEAGMAEGVAWKLAPLRCFPDRWELSFDNDCIFWETPTAIGRWLRGRAGKGFVYRDVNGRRISDRHTLDRLRHLAVPPACLPEHRNTGTGFLPPSISVCPRAGRYAASYWK